MRMMDKLYRKEQFLGWSAASFEEKWKMMLFPFQNEISSANDEDVLDRLMAVRMEILFELAAFVSSTGRLENSPAGEGTFFDM